jgi:hypothetical protein
MSYNVSTTQTTVYQSISTKRLNTVMAADDSPYEEITLPWTFNYFGRNIYRIFVNPNGALHMNNSTQPSCDCFNGDFNTSYYGVIAGYLTDFYPMGNSISNITYSLINESIVTVSFKNVPHFDKPFTTQSVDMSLFRDGRIIIRYVKIANQNDDVPWISGIRIPYYNRYYYDI